MAFTRNNAMIFGAIVISVGVGLKIADCDKDGTSALCIQFIAAGNSSICSITLITNYKLCLYTACLFILIFKFKFRQEWLVDKNLNQADFVKYFDNKIINIKAGQK